jgi:hypothetical protein
VRFRYYGRILPPRPTALPAEPLSPGLLFACVLGLLMAATAGMWTLKPDLGRPKNISRAERPSDDYYLAHDHGGHVDHHVLYFGTDAEALDHLKRADVLFVGNSRLMFAARPRVLDAFFEPRGLRYYVLGFGFREADRFPLAIIQKFDLRPRMVIVNADGFFQNSLSDFARTVMKDTPFGAWKFGQEAEAGHEVRRALHQLVPNYVDLFGRPGFPWRRELVIYRSRSNGTWQLSPWEPGTSPVLARNLSLGTLARHEVAAARRFKAALDARGSSLVLTYVPTPRPYSSGPALVAELLGVPFVEAQPGGLLTEDGDHLDEASAIAWSEAFVRELGRALP